MNLSRFFLGLALLALALLAFEFATDPLAEKNIAATMGFAIGFVGMGVLIWGLIIWGSIRLIRGPDKAPDIRSFALYAAAILVAIFIVFRSIVGTPLSETERFAFSSGVEKTCFSSQRKSDENAGLDDLQLREYCSCVSSSLGAEVTEEEVKYVAVNAVLPASLQNKSQKIAERCSQQLLQKWQGGN